MQAGERVKQPGLANSFARFSGVGTEVPTPMLAPMLAPIPEGGETRAGMPALPQRRQVLPPALYIIAHIRRSVSRCGARALENSRAGELAGASRSCGSLVAAARRARSAVPTLNQEASSDRAT